MPPPMLKVIHTAFAYGPRQVLEGVSLELKKGEVGTLIGTSGSGKTTLFKLLTGMLDAQSGSILIDGKALPEGHGHAAYMMQEDLLLPWRTILKNMTLIAELGKESRDTDELSREAKELLLEMGLVDYPAHYPDELSGGMRQRVSLARALLQKRPLLLLDEPFGSLDVTLREQMYELLRRVQKKTGTTILLITHDFRDALSLSDRIFLLDNKRISTQWEVTDTIRNDPHASVSLLEELRTAMRGHS